MFALQFESGLRMLKQRRTFPAGKRIVAGLTLLPELAPVFILVAVVAGRIQTKKGALLVA